ncbi:hypothetical protein GJ496_000981 [Pomphorhynchus laevis]|nr:hypothetical protein GJ496_000981 [Pomphorhynchus laevis]
MKASKQLKSLKLEIIVDNSLKVLELFSGIGGFAQALPYTSIKFTNLAAVDVNDCANSVYNYNFPMHNVIQCAIDEKFQSTLLSLLQQCDILLMSPPCQPFTRLGNQYHEKDSRSSALNIIIETLKSMGSLPKYIMLENVCNFEHSFSCKELLKLFSSRNYKLEQFIISPIQIGIPNSRLRYYLLASLNSSGPISTDNICDNSCDFLKVNAPDDNLYIQKFIPCDWKDFAIKLLEQISNMRMDQWTNNCISTDYRNCSNGTMVLIEPHLKRRFTFFL